MLLRGSGCGGDDGAVASCWKGLVGASRASGGEDASGASVRTADVENQAALRMGSGLGRGGGRGRGGSHGNDRGPRGRRRSCPLATEAHSSAHAAICKAVSVRGGVADAVGEALRGGAHEEAGGVRDPGGAAGQTELRVALRRLPATASADSLGEGAACDGRAAKLGAAAAVEDQRVVEVVWRGRARWIAQADAVPDTTLAPAGLAGEQVRPATGGGPTWPRNRLTGSAPLLAGTASGAVMQRFRVMDSPSELATDVELLYESIEWGTVAPMVPAGTAGSVADIVTKSAAISASEEDGADEVEDGAAPAPAEEAEAATA